MKIIDKGLTDYSETLALQREIFSKKTELKKRGEDAGEDIVLLTEHYPVVTLGRHAKEENLLLPESMLAERGVPVYRIERGGDVTYHAPGQLVVYPIIDLEKHRIGVKQYVDILEESVIRTISHFGIAGERVKGASGVWIGAGTSEERKICALGVKCSRFITMHGLALNVNTDLSGFGLINPCGFTDKGVTSIAEESGNEVSMDEVKDFMKEELRGLLV